MPAKKYIKEILEEAIKRSDNWGSVADVLGTSRMGGTRDWLKKKAIEYQIDFSHFKGRAWNKGLSGLQISYRKKPEEILIIYPKGNDRIRASFLRRALLEIGRSYTCSICGIDNWNDSQIQLEVDHINGDYLDCTKENLRFICPNCHSQTDNYKNKRRD